jgi:SpoVK/Ycf46/Vps4 family AAA+-type ATPase
MIRKKMSKVIDSVDINHFAEKIEQTTSFNIQDLPTVQQDQINTIVEKVSKEFAGKRQFGIRALFAGPSGTGKTLAAGILANGLGLDLYRVDLAAVVNKYIGETEKNLHKVLSRAEELNVILLLDEGDSLFGSRTSANDSNEGYANMDTNYLLSLMEKYKVIAILASDQEEATDKNTRSRFDFALAFDSSPKSKTQVKKTRLSNNN